jgi:hypothetical protein
LLRVDKLSGNQLISAVEWASSGLLGFVFDMQVPEIIPSGAASRCLHRK